MMFRIRVHSHEGSNINLHFAGAVSRDLLKPFDAIYIYIYMYTYIYISSRPKLEPCLTPAELCRGTSGATANDPSARKRLLQANAKPRPECAEDKVSGQKG